MPDPLIVDMINDFAHIEGEQYLASTKDIIPFIQGELQYFRERMRPVVFCNSIVNACTPADHRQKFRAQVIQGLSPRTGEICVKKTRPNAFFATDLSAILTDLKIKTLTIVGAYAICNI